MVSPLQLCWVKGVCMFMCNPPPALLAEWPGSFTCHCGNTGMEQTPNKSQHTKLTLEKKILPPLLLGFKLTTFRSWVQRSYQQAIPATLHCNANNNYYCRHHNHRIETALLLSHKEQAGVLSPVNHKGLYQGRHIKNNYYTVHTKATIIMCIPKPQNQQSSPLHLDMFTFNVLH